MNSFRNIAKITAIGTALTVVSAISSVSAADLSAVPAGEYQVDDTHAYINFQYNHLGLSNPTLSFDDFTIDMNLDNEDPTKSTITVAIDTNSVVAGSSVWKDHLTGDKWLDTPTHPAATFVSSAIESTGDDTFAVTGDLTLKGITKAITLDITINAAKNHPMKGTPVIGLDATGNLLRSDFGLGKYAPNIGDEVALNISVEMTKSE